MKWSFVRSWRSITFARVVYGCEGSTNNCRSLLGRRVLVERCECMRSHARPRLTSACSISQRPSHRASKQKQASASAHPSRIYTAPHRAALHCVSFHIRQRTSARKPPEPIPSPQQSGAKPVPVSPSDLTQPLLHRRIWN